MSRAQRWSAATAGVVVLVLVAGWMLLISPQRSHSSDLRGQADSASQQVSSLKDQARRLSAKASNVAAQVDQINEIGAKVPPTEDLADYVRSLTTAASKANVDLLSISPGAATAVQVVAPPKPAPSATPTADAATPTNAATSTGGGGIQVIPIQLSVAGGYFEIREFLANLEQLTRATDVVSLSLDTGGTRFDEGGGGALITDSGGGWQTLSGTITLDIFMTNGPLAVVTPPPSPSPSKKGSR